MSDPKGEGPSEQGGVDAENGSRPETAQSAAATTPAPEVSTDTGQQAEAASEQKSSTPSRKGSAEQKVSGESGDQESSDSKGATDGEERKPSEQTEDEEAIAEVKRKLALPDTLPDGAKALFITGTSQTIYKCTIDEDVSETSPIVMLPKETIMADFKKRAAVCDFQAFKEQIIAYPGDEILLLYDQEYKYGENFVVCLTEEAKQAILELPYESAKRGEGGDEDEDDEVEGDVPAVYTPVPQPWENLGSDLEVIAEQCRTERPLVTVKVWRKRRLFGAPVAFENADFGDKAVEHIASSGDPEKPPVKILEQDKAVQAIPETIDSMDQTVWHKTVNAATQYQPRMLDETTSTQTTSTQTTAMSTCDTDDIKEQKIVEEARETGDKVQEVMNRTLEDVVLSLLPDCEMGLQQNEIMDLFFDDYRELPLEEGGLTSKSDKTMKEYQSFTDLRYSKDKTSTCVRWHPEIKGLIGVSYAQALTFDERIEQASTICLNQSLILLWSYSDPIHPLLLLEAPEDVMTFDFCPTHPNVLAAGCISGQIVLWDLSEYDEKLRNHMVLGKDNKGEADTGPKMDTAREREKGIFEGSLKTRQANAIRFHASAGIEEGHQTAITDLMWLPPNMEINKNGIVLKSKSEMAVQLVTSSADGAVNVWDMRPPPKKPNEMPKKEVPHPADAVLRSAKHGGRIPPTFKHLNLLWKPTLHLVYEKADKTSFFSPYRLAIRFTPEAEPLFSKDIVLNPLGGTDQGPLDDSFAKFFIGTESGELLYVSWGLVKESETSRMIAPFPEQIYKFHTGAVSSLERSPFFDDIILSVSSWTFAIWKEGLQAGALLQSASSTSNLTVGKWSPTRPGVFFIGKSNGSVDIWDLNDKSHQPTLSQNVSALGITALVPRVQKGRKKQVHLAIGDASGTLHVTELPWSLCRCSSSEKSTVRAFFDREADRHNYMRNLVSTNSVAKESHRAAEEAKANASNETTKERKARQTQEYAEFKKYEHTLLVKLGIIEEPNKDD